MTFCCPDSRCSFSSKAEGDIIHALGDGGTAGACGMEKEPGPHWFDHMTMDTMKWRDLDGLGLDLGPSLEIVFSFFQVARRRSADGGWWR